MKKYGIFAVVLITVFLLQINAYASDEKSETKEHSEHEEMKEETAKPEHKVYQCPMKCEGDVIYTKEGKCPKCKMDLKETIVSEAYHCAKCEGKKVLHKEKKVCAHCGMDFTSYPLGLLGDAKEEMSDHTAVDDSKAVEAEKTDHPAK